MYLGHDPCRHSIYKLSRGLLKQPLNIFLDLGARHGEGFYELGNEIDCPYMFVEPSPRCIPYITTLIRSFPDKPLILIDGILGEKTGFTQMHLFDNDDDQSGNLFSNRSGIYGDSQLVDIKVYSYDTVPFNNIGFAKINIEGGEYELTESSFFDKIDSFVMEVHNRHVPGKTYVDIIKKLESSYDLISYGDLSYKYCFISGVHIS